MDQSLFLGVIPLASAILGVVLSPLLNDFVQARQENRKRQSQLWEGDIKKLNDFERCLAELLRLASIADGRKDKREEAIVKRDGIISQIYFFKVSMPPYEQFSDDYTALLLLFMLTFNATLTDLGMDEEQQRIAFFGTDRAPLVTLEKLCNYMVQRYRSILFNRKVDTGFEETDLINFRLKLQSEIDSITKPSANS